MPQSITIDELEQEILYLREQNQKLLKELSRVVEENSDLREERAKERKRLNEILEGPDVAYGPNQNQMKCRKFHGEEDDHFCLN